MSKRLALSLLGTLLLTSCATPRPQEATEPRFNEENNADFVIRHYSDEVSRVFKPMQMEGPFLSTLAKQDILDLAKRQPSRELAVVILLRSNSSDAVKQDWMKMLTEVGYKRVVFLRAENSRLKVNGLPVLDFIRAKATDTDRQA
jgi:hypothetical protein